MYIPSPEGNFMRIRFQGMFFWSINSFHVLHTSLHLVKLWLSSSSKMCSQIWGRIPWNFISVCSILVNIWQNIQEFVLNYEQSARNLACSCRKWGENCLVPYPLSLPPPLGYTQRIQHVSLVNVVATTWPYSCLVLAAGESVTGRHVTDLFFDPGQRITEIRGYRRLFRSFMQRSIFEGLFFVTWFERRNSMGRMVVLDKYIDQDNVFHSFIGRQ